MARLAGKRDQQQDHEHCACEEQEVSDGVLRNIRTNSSGECCPDYFHSGGYWEQDDYAQREPHRMSVVVHDAQPCDYATGVC